MKEKEFGPIFTIHLFPDLERELITLLKSFSAQDWEIQTISPKWKVKDIAAHLLDGNIRTLSMLRDGHSGEKPEKNNSYQDLVDFLNRLNSDWVKAMKRVSPKVLIELLEITGKEFLDFIQTLNPYEKSAYPVAWAGEQESANWFHIAREYTEKWHHQQQIRFAVGQSEILYSRKFYFPYLDTSMRALPHHYREMKAVQGNLIKFTITGASGGTWFLHFNGKKWILQSEGSNDPICTVTIEGEIAWRLFTKGITRQQADKGVVITGNQYLGKKIFDMLAVMA